MNYLISLLAASLILSGCAQNDFELASAKRGTHGKIQANATNLTIDATPASYHLHADTYDPATATLAGGTASAAIVGAVSKGVADALATYFGGKAIAPAAAILRK